MKTLGADGLDLIAEDSRGVTLWEAKVVRDRGRARAVQSAEIARATECVVRRAIEAGADAVALTGSTSRGRRTAVSDLDFHVVGDRPALDGIELDVDVYATSVAVLFERLRAGDDYVQWTLRFGCVLHDTGVLRAAAAELVASGAWPSPERKLTQVRRLLDLARVVVESGDEDAAAEQVRSALTGLARWVLLAEGTFPMSRAELPDQLRTHGADDVAAMLDRSIHAQLSLEELSAAVELGSRLAGRPATQLASRGVRLRAGR